MNFAKERVARCPSSWERKRIKHHISRFFGGGTPAKDNVNFWVDGTIPWVSSKDMKVARLTDTEDYITEAALAGSSTSMVQPGSVIIVVRSGILKHSIPVAINDVPVALNQDLKAIELRRSLDRRFFQYWVTGQQKDLLLEWRQLGATVDSIDIDTLRNTVIPLPDLDTQKAIVYFLDRETARIDALMEKKRLLLVAMEEKKKAFASEVSTRGLNPAEKMQATGIGIVPEAPAHWEVMRVARVFREVAEKGIDGLPVLSVSINWGISDKELDDEDRHRVVNQIADKTSYKRIRPNDLVYNMMRAWQGGFGVSRMEGLVSPAYVVARPHREIHAAYYEHLLRTPMWIEEFRRVSKGIADFRQRLYWEHFRMVPILVPPLREQERIASAIAANNRRLDRVRQKVSESIDRLTELRASLITAAVTGQIDPATYRRHGTTDRALEKIEAEMAP